MFREKIGAPMIEEGSGKEVEEMVSDAGMKKNDQSLDIYAVRIILLLMLTFYFVLCCNKSQVSAFAEEKPKELSREDYYGRQTLRKMKNGENYLFVYDKIVEGVANHEEKIKVYDSKHSVSADEIMLVYNTYRADYPQHFWRSNEVSYTYSGSEVWYLNVKYVFSKEQYIKERSKFEKEVNRILSNIDISMNEFDRELEIHDMLAEMIEYDLDATYAHKAYGAILDGRAVCEGYARAFQYLLYKAGIQSMVVSGGGHAWNLVRIDGEYYYTDLTWDDDDGDEYLSHAYFNQTQQVMQLDHTLEADISLPKCTSVNANYYYQTGRVMSSYSMDTIANILKDNSVIEVYFICDTSGLKEWYYNNIDEIADKAGINTALSYQYGCWNTGCASTLLLEGEREADAAKVEPDSFLNGDVNGDTVINIKDSSLIKRYLAGWNVSINQSAADINHDGMINVKDHAALKRRLAGWNV